MFIFHDLFDDLFFEYELSIIFWNCPTFIFFDPWLNYDHDDLKFHHNRAKYYTCIYIFLHFLHFWCWHSFTQQNLRHPSTWVNYRTKTFLFFHGSVTAETDVERCHPAATVTWRSCFRQSYGCWTTWTTFLCGIHPDCHRAHPHDWGWWLSPNHL